MIESLKSINGYPVPLRTLNNIRIYRGLPEDAEVTVELLNSTEYKLAKADILMWVASAPNVTQEGISYGLLATDRAELRAQAKAIYAELGEAIPEANKPKYGYQGDRL